MLRIIRSRKPFWLPRWAGFRVGEAPVVMKERQGGVSSIRSFKSAYYMIKVSLSLIIDRLSIKKIHQPKSK